VCCIKQLQYNIAIDHRQTYFSTFCYSQGAVVFPDEAFASFVGDVVKIRADNCVEKRESLPI